MTKLIDMIQPYAMSKGQVRRLVLQGVVFVNGKKVEDLAELDRELSSNDVVTLKFRSSYNGKRT